MKDHEHVARFMSLFAKLKDMVDDPSDLVALSKQDDTVNEACLELHRAAFSLDSPEMTNRELFIAPADPKFISAWREYEDFYQPALATISINDLIGADLEGAPLTALERFDLDWQAATQTANAEIEQIRTMLRFVDRQLEFNGDRFDDEYVEEIELGHAAILGYANLHGPKIGGVLRRRRLVPFTLIPRHVANRHGSNEKMSLYTHLRQAQDAFVYGLPFAAIALIRSVLEMVLKHHYQAQGANLEQLIRNAKGLPGPANPARLHKIQDLANSILHFDPDKASLPENQEELDRDIIGLLLALRVLIEQAPEKAAWPAKAR